MVLVVRSLDEALAFIVKELNNKRCIKIEETPKSVNRFPEFLCGDFVNFSVKQSGPSPAFRLR